MRGQRIAATSTGGGSPALSRYAHAIEASIGGYTILEAGGLDEAVRLVRSHPFLTRGGSLQVSEAVSVGG